MASQRRFEGPALQALLERVRAEVGPAARIVGANRVRKGGLSGFFARELFEVVVDLSDEEEVPTSRPRRGLRRRRDAGATERVPEEPAIAGAGTRTATTILDLAEAVNQSERTAEEADDMRDSTDDMPGGPAHDGPEMPRGPAVGDASQRATARYIDLESEETALSTEGPRFADVLERIARAVDAAGPGTGGHAADVEEPTTSITVARDQEPTVVRTAARTTARVPSTPTPPTTPVAPTMPAAASSPTSPPPAPEPTVPPPVRAGGRAAAAPTFRRVGQSSDVLARPEHDLARLGLPARLVPRNVPTRDLRGALIVSLASLPAVPAVPSGYGIVVAVVGIGSDPLGLARDLAIEHRVDSEAIELASRSPLDEGVPAWLQIVDADDAEVRRRSWRRRTQPTIVGVAVRPETTDLGFAREILDRLEPTIVWGVVEAGRKTEDVRAWAERLGGVDALALRGLDETFSPAALLDLGVPVGRIDGVRSTAVAWAELLMQRMER